MFLNSSFTMNLFEIFFMDIFFYNTHKIHLQSNIQMPYNTTMNFDTPHHRAKSAMACPNLEVVHALVLAKPKQLITWWL